MAIIVDHSFCFPAELHTSRFNDSEYYAILESKKYNLSYNKEVSFMRVLSFLKRDLLSSSPCRWLNSVCNSSCTYFLPAICERFEDHHQACTSDFFSQPFHKRCFWRCMPPNTQVCLSVCLPVCLCQLACRDKSGRKSNFTVQYRVYTNSGDS